MTHPYETAENGKAPPSASSSTATLMAESGFSASTSTLAAKSCFLASTTTLVADKGFSASTSTLVEEETKKIFSCALVAEEEKAPPSTFGNASTSDTGPQISALLTPGTTIGAQELFDFLLRGGHRIYVPQNAFQGASGDAAMPPFVLNPPESRWLRERRYRVVSVVPLANTPELPYFWAVCVQAMESDEDEDVCRRTGLEEVDS